MYVSFLYPLTYLLMFAFRPVAFLRIFYVCDSFSMCGAHGTCVQLLTHSVFSVIPTSWFILLA